MISGSSGKKLSDLIKKAIDDFEVTTSEYEEILALASDDQHIDDQERSLLKQLQDMLANNTIKRIRD
jgi:hypothetical protein